MPKIIDIVTYLNEAELYRARLEYLSPVVDEFVLIEGDRTHADVPKGIDCPQDIIDEVIHIYEPLPVGEGQNWNRVHCQRNAQENIYRSAEDRAKYKDYIFLFSDLDEIPNVDIVRELRDGETERAKNWLAHLRHGSVAVFAQEMYYYHPLCLAQYWWQGTRVATLDTLLRYTPQQVRHDTERMGISEFVIPKPFNEMPCLSNPNCEEEETGGVHCTYWGGAEAVSYKMLNIAESTGFVTREMADPTRLAKLIEQGLDPYGRTEHIYYLLDKPRKSMPEPILRRFMK